MLCQRVPDLLAAVHVDLAASLDRAQAQERQVADVVVVVVGDDERVDGVLLRDREVAQKPTGVQGDVVVDQDIPNASLTVAFDRCGFARTPVTSLTAGSRTSLTTSVVDLSDDGPLHDGVGAARYCEFPAATARVIVSLWRSGQPVTPLLTREFPNAYTFAMP